MYVCVCVYIYIYIYICMHGGARGVMVIEFKSRTRLISFHIALIPLGKVGQTRFFSLGEATSLGEGKL